MFLFRRVVRLLARPRAEWATIAAEPDEIAAITQSYVGPLALLPAAAPLIGLALTAGRYLGAAGTATALTAAMVSWVVAVLGSVAAAAIIEKGIAYFEADGNLTQAFKLVAYALTPFWLSGVSYATNPYSLFALAGAAWSAWLLYIGAPLVMNVPHAKAGRFTAACAAVIIATHALLRAIFVAFRIPVMGY